MIKFDSVLITIGRYQFICNIWFILCIPVWVHVFDWSKIR